MIRFSSNISVQIMISKYEKDVSEGNDVVFRGIKERKYKIFFAFWLSLL